MFHKGLCKEYIAEAAVDLIEKYGYEEFSMRRLAENLGVKTASLYAHIENMNSLLTHAGLIALQEQKDYQLAAIKGKSRDEAVMSLAKAYLDYAKQHKELYRFVMKMPISNDGALKQAAEVVTEPVMQALSGYLLTDEQKMHWQRVLRGLMHGFVSQQENGYFSHYPVNVQESYHIAIQCLTDGLHKEEMSNNAEG